MFYSRLFNFNNQKLGSVLMKKMLIMTHNMDVI